MSKEVLDRRVLKTRKLLQDALITLISEKGFESVTIQEILDRANVGRSTFYFHFGNKYELMHSCFEDFCNLFEQHSTSNNYETDFTVSLFRLVEQNYRLFKVVLGIDGLNMVNNPIHDYIFAYVKVALKKSASNKEQTSLHTEMLVHYIASAFFGTLKWWVDNDIPCTVEEVDKYFKQFARYDISEIL